MQTKASKVRLKSVEEKNKRQQSSKDKNASKVTEVTKNLVPGTVDNTEEEFTDFAKARSQREC